MTRDEFLAAKQDGQIPTLAEVVDLNLCDLGFAINYGMTKIKAPETGADYTACGKIWRLFQIEDPCRVSIVLTKSQLDGLRGDLEQHRHTVDYYPAHWFKRQRTPLHGLTLNCGYHDWDVDIRLLDFNFSYGHISVNGITCDISHSASSGRSEYTSIDYATGWHLVGAHALPAIKSILATSRN